MISDRWWVTPFAKPTDEELEEAVRLVVERRTERERSGSDDGHFGGSGT